MSCVGLQNHLCWKRLARYEDDQPGWNVDVATSVGKSHHYKKCHFDEYHSKNGLCLRMMSRESFDDRTMMKYGEELAHRVVKKLVKLDLAEPSDDDKWKLYNPVP